MTIVSENPTHSSPPAPRGPEDRSRAKPPRRIRWFIIVGVLLAILVGGVVGFNAFRAKMIAGFFKNMAENPQPITVSATEAKNEVIPNLQVAVGALAAVRQVNVTSDVSGRITEILFEGGSRVKKGQPLVQLYDAPEQADLANFKAQQTVAQQQLERAKALASRNFGPQATVDTTQGAFDQATAGIARTEAVISQKLVRAPFDGDLGVRQVNLGQYLTAGSQIVTLTDLSNLFVNFTVTEKDSGTLKVGQIVRVKVDAYPGKTFEGKITTIEPQIASDTRNIRVQATLDNPDNILRPGMFATTTVVLPEKPAVVTVPETAVDYTLYGDSVYVVIEKKEGDKTKLVAERTFVKTGDRVNGRTVILSGVKAGDRVISVGQLKLQSGATVAISNDPALPIPAKTPLN